MFRPPQFIPFTLATLLGSTIALASDDPELTQLLELLQEQTTIATQTRLNADYVPGMLTVLHGDRLERSGVKNVWEALALVPGIENGLEETGRQQVVIRGLGRTFASGNVKFLLDGVAMNTAQLGYASPVLGIPVNQIERIEVIRGPGSAVHGEYAYSGVVNVITRKQVDRLNLRAASGRDYQAGLITHHQSATHPFSMSLNLSTQQERGVSVESGEDLLHAQGFAEFSNAPGPSNEAREDRHLLLAMQYRDTSVDLQWLEQGYGDHFGINFNLPPDDRHIVYRQRQQGISLQHRLLDSDTVTSGIQLGWMAGRQRTDDLYGGYFYDEESDWLFGPDRIDTAYDERRYQLGSDLLWRGWANQQWLLAWQYSDIKITKSHLRATEADLVWLDGEHPLYSLGTNRRIHSLTLQDEISLGTALTLTAGLRYDDYSDVSDSLSPRLAGVWRLNPRHILKAQYAEAFRPPTLFELGGAAYTGDTLEPATIRSGELGYIHKGLQGDLRLTLFRSQIRNQVMAGEDAEGNFGYHNIGQALNQGAELEWEQQLAQWLRLDGNLSWLHSRERATDEPLAGSNRWLGNLGLEYRATPHWWLDLRYRYTGKSWREVDDPRPPLASYQRVDLTLSRYQLFQPETRLRLGVKNLLDHEIYQPAPADTYPDDLPRPGRTWWLAMQHDF